MKDAWDPSPGVMNDPRLFWYSHPGNLLCTQPAHAFSWMRVQALTQSHRQELEHRVQRSPGKEQKAALRDRQGAGEGVPSPGLWACSTPLFHPPFPWLASPGWGKGEGLPRSCILHKVVESRVGREEESSEVASGTGRREQECSALTAKVPV